MKKNILILITFSLLTLAIIGISASLIKNKTEKKQLDENNMYIINDNYIESFYPLNENSVLNMSKKINHIYETFLTNNQNVFYSIIPDKNYFSQDGYPTFDYSKMVKILNENVKNIKYINIFDTLTISDYYKTDPHWRQEKLYKVVNRLGEYMGFSIGANTFEQQKYSPYIGTYKKYISNPNIFDEMIYLTNEFTENAYVENYEDSEFFSVYNEAKLNTAIPYDIFLSGATPLITITNASAKSDKELIVFRDSFASSLTPLIISEYSKITLIDLRYILTALLDNFIDFENQDVLFLYSTGVINNSTMLK